MWSRSILAALLILAGCTGGGDGVTRPVSATFVESEDPTAAEIEVTVADRLPLETAELVAPDGSAIAAHRIDRSKVVERHEPEPSVGVGVFAGSRGRVGTSVGINVPVGRSGAPYDPVIESRARLRVPDMAAYRAGWPEYRVRLQLGTSDVNRRTMEIPAPRPPEG